MNEDLSVVRTQISIQREKDRAKQAQAIRQQRPQTALYLGKRDAKSGLWTLTTNSGETLVNGQKISNAALKESARVTPKLNGNLIALDSKPALGKSRIKLITPTSPASNKVARFTGEQLKNQGYLNRQIFSFPEEQIELDSLIYLYTLDEGSGVTSYYVGGLKSGSKLVKTFTSQYTIIWAYVDNLGSKKYSVDFIYDFANGIDPITRKAEHVNIDSSLNWVLDFNTSTPFTGANYRPTVVSKGYGFFRTIPFVSQNFPSGVDASATYNSRMIYAFKGVLKQVDYFSRRDTDGIVLINDQKDYAILFPLDDAINGIDFNIYSKYSTLNNDTSFYTEETTRQILYRTDKKFTKAIGDQTKLNSSGGVSSTENKFAFYKSDGSINPTAIDYAIDADVFGDFDLLASKFTSVQRSTVYITNDTTETPLIPVRFYDYSFKLVKTKNKKTELPTVKNSSLIVVNYSYCNK